MMIHFSLKVLVKWFRTTGLEEDSYSKRKSTNLCGGENKETLNLHFGPSVNCDKIRLTQFLWRHSV